MKKIAVTALFLAFGFLAGCTKSTPIDIPPGKVLLEEFADLQCPACGAAEPLIEKLRERFGNDLIMRFVHFPLEQLHDNAFHAAEAAECARVQGEEYFLPFISEAYKNQKSLVDDTFKTIAEKLGLNAEQYAQCLTAGDMAARVRKDMREGTSRGINATPTIFLNGEKVEQRKYEAMVLKIEELLGKRVPEKAPEENTDAMAQ